MVIQDLSITFQTEKVKECTDFYCNYFDAAVIFDWGWYVTIKFKGTATSDFTLSFQKNHDNYQREYFAGGVSINIQVEDVDATYERLTSLGVATLSSPEDHEWGDRSFSVTDPIGNMVYLYSLIPN